ncbi:MAG: response regulator transcription factor [Ignavibacteriales bacterium]|nr:response regulator transcription factor [Ignavibacteriales bacterium]MCF8306501.1 response regulator transcription factor [Ignavibacteriales bacterium]MCF8316300.1 response regulator transcription factor [Ignavibacteriales bacterium]MCF8437742.1 response regulator transcription factor [Ignavibacteriales bacterium]
MARILIVEDEPSMRLGLKDNLEFEGYEVEFAEDGKSGLSKILSARFDLILLDVMLPQMSGFDVCKKSRESGVDAPIILLTAKGDEIDKVLGLELGADDYITKPFSLRELLARIKAVLRRSGGEGSVQGEPIKIGNLLVDFQAYSAMDGTEEAQLSHKEFEILHHLWKNRNKTVSRDSLLTEIWGYDSSPTTRTVDNFILRLRQKIEEDHEKPRIIITVHGIGYKLVI